MSSSSNGSSNENNTNDNSSNSRDSVNPTPPTVAALRRLIRIARDNSNNSNAANDDDDDISSFSGSTSSSSSSSLLLLDKELEGYVTRCEELDISDEMVFSSKLDTNVLNDGLDALESLCNKLDIMELEYLLEKPRTPVVCERDASKIGENLGVLLTHDMWTDIVRNCLSVATPTLRTNIRIKNLGLKFLRIVYHSSYAGDYEHPVLTLDLLIPPKRLFQYAYGDGYLAESQADFTKAPPPDETSKQVIEWWRSNPKEAGELRANATWLLASLEMGYAPSLLEPHADSGVHVPMPRVLLSRLSSQLIPEYQKNTTTSSSASPIKPNTKKRPRPRRNKPSSSSSSSGGSGLATLNDACGELSISPKPEEDNASRVAKLRKFWQLSKEISGVLRVFDYTSVNKALLRPILQHHGLRIMLQLLQVVQDDIVLMQEVLHLIGALCVHRKFASEFVDHGGAALLFKLGVTSTPMQFLFYGSSWAYCARNLSGEVTSKLCQLPFIKQLVAFMLNLVGHELDVIKHQAVTFLALSMRCPLIIRIVDTLDGPKKVLDMLASPISAKMIRKVEATVRDVLHCLSVYLRVHVVLAVHSLRLASKSASSASVSPVNHQGGTSSSSLRKKQLPDDKPLDVDSSSHASSMAYLRSNLEEAMQLLTKRRWKPIEVFLNYQFFNNATTEKASSTKQQVGLIMLLQVVRFASQMEVPRGGCVASAIHALQILQVITLLPSTYKLVCEASVPVLYSPLSGQHVVTVPPSDSTETVQGITVLLDAAVTPFETRNPRIIILVLEILCNCCAPSCGDDRAQRPVRRLARDNNALMTLLALLRYNETPSHADKIRYLACVVLRGLANDHHIAQVLRTLNITQALTKLIQSGAEPVVVDNKKIHRKLKREALKLIEQISGTNAEVGDVADATNRRLIRNTIVDRTQISFNSWELMELIQEHLKENGFTQASTALQQEIYAKRALHLQQQQPRRRLVWPTNYISVAKPREFRFVKALPPKARDRKKKKRTAGFTPGKTDEKRRRVDSDDQASSTVSNLALSFPTTRQHPPGFLHSNGTYQCTGLERIMQEYLREQHRKCLDPVSIIPPLPLGVEQQHQCSSSAERVRSNFSSRTSSNMLDRVRQREMTGKIEQSLVQDVRFVHGRSCCVRTFNHVIPEDRSNEDALGPFFCSVGFYNGGNYEDLLFGTSEGNLVLRNTETGASYAKWKVHDDDRAIRSLTVTPDPSRVLTKSDSSRLVLSRLPPELVDMDHERSYQHHTDNRNEELETLWELAGVNDVEMDLQGTKIVCQHSRGFSADGPGAAVYDLQTGAQVVVLFDHNLGSKYSWHRPCITPDGSSVLHDGVLWDVRANSVIHKFDKLSQSGRATFKPDGTQVVIDSAVWDMRTFKLFATCPSFHNSVVTFDNMSSVAYSYHDNGDDKQKSGLNVTDALDYSKITTKYTYPHAVVDLALSSTGSQLAVLVDENIDDNSGFWDDELVVCRLYEIGRVGGQTTDSLAFKSESQNGDDSEQNEEEPSSDSESSDSSSSSSSESSSSMSGVIDGGDFSDDDDEFYFVDYS